MCLHVVYTSNINNKNKIGIKHTGLFRGYKAYFMDNGRLYNDVNSVHPKKWNKANNVKIDIYESGNLYYPSGFHIFTDVEDALAYGDFSSYYEPHEYGINTPAIFLVEYKNIVAIGKQWESDLGLTVIAKDMRVVRKLSYKEVKKLDDEE